MGMTLTDLFRRKKYMIEVLDEESGIVIAVLDARGPWTPSDEALAKLVRAIEKAYGYDAGSLTLSSDLQGICTLIQNKV